MGLFKQLKPSVSLAIETESDQNKLRVRRIINVLSFLLCKPLCVGNGGHEWASIPSTPTCIANSITWRWEVWLVASIVSSRKWRPLAHYASAVTVSVDEHDNNGHLMQWDQEVSQTYVLFSRCPMFFRVSHICRQRHNRSITMPSSSLLAVCIPRIPFEVFSGPVNSGRRILA